MTLIATSQEELANTVGVGTSTIRRWLKEGCPGDASSNKYPVRDVVLWARENKWEGDPDGSLIDSIGDEDLKRDLVKERVEKLKRENRLADFKIEERDASLVDIAFVKRFLAEYASRMRNAITTVEKKYGSESCAPIRSSIDMTERELSGGVFDIGDSRD